MFDSDDVVDGEPEEARVPREMAVFATLPGAVFNKTPERERNTPDYFAPFMHCITFVFNRPA